MTACVANLSALGSFWIWRISRHALTVRNLVANTAPLRFQAHPWKSTLTQLPKPCVYPLTYPLTFPEASACVMSALKYVIFIKRPARGFIKAYLTMRFRVIQMKTVYVKHVSVCQKLLKRPNWGWRLIRMRTKKMVLRWQRTNRKLWKTDRLAATSLRAEICSTYDFQLILDQGWHSKVTLRFRKNLLLHRTAVRQVQVILRNLQIAFSLKLMNGKVEPPTGFYIDSGGIPSHLVIPSLKSRQLMKCSQWIRVS